MKNYKENGKIQLPIKKKKDKKDYNSTIWIWTIKYI
jgi:hypothetical protein